MDEEMETLLVEVRAGTAGFREDLQAMRGVLDSTLLEGFARAGSVLESGLLSAIRRGSLGFDDLKRTALQAMSEIAAQAVQLGIGSLLGGNGASVASQGLAGLLSNTLGGLFGLAPRAIGGPVSPGRPFLVGERGPEMFVPASAGRVDPLPSASRPGRDIRVAINLAAPRGTDAPVALRRSARQVASALRGALDRR